MLPPDGTVGDGAINTADTYFVMDISMGGSIDITSPDPFWDPATETYTNIVTVPMTAEEYHLEGGYDIYGNTLLDQWSNDDGAQGSGVALTHIYNDYTTMYDQFGSPIADDGTQDLIGMTGSLVNSVDPTQMVIPVYGGGGGGGGGNCPINHPDCVVLQTNMLVPLAPGAPGSPQSPPAPRRDGWTVRANVLEHTYADDNVAAPEALGDVVHLADGPTPIDTLGGSHTLRSTTTYLRQENNWVLDHSDEVTEHRAHGFAMKISRHLRYRNVRARSNAKNETKRDSIRATTPLQRPHGVPHRALPMAGVTANGSLAMLGSAQTVSPSANVRTPTGRATIAPQIASDLMVHPGLGGTRALVLQHGIFSSEATWTSYMSGQLSSGQLPSALQFSSNYIPSLNSTDQLEVQITDLEGRVSSNDVGNSSTIYVGHSQGGLIARRMGQERPDLVGGVVVIGTPNLGAPLLQNGPAAIAGTFDAIFANGNFQTCYAHYNGGLCDLTTLAATHVFGALVQYALQSAVPATADLTPFSPFMFNVHGYEGFRRASIAVNAAAPWRFMRLVGDIVGGCDANGYCQGRAYAKRTEVAYKGISGCSFLASFFHRLLSIGAACSATRDVMKGMDAAYNSLIAANKGESDAIVPVASQHYPSNPGTYPAERFYIHDGDSHVGETRSRWTFDALKNQALPRVMLP